MTTWTERFSNPFDAVHAAANANGTPDDFDRVVQVFVKSTTWDNFDYQNYLDDLFQEIGAATNIVIRNTENGRYRAAYDL